MTVIHILTKDNQQLLICQLQISIKIIEILCLYHVNTKIQSLPLGVMYHTIEYIEQHNSIKTENMRVNIQILTELVYRPAMVAVKGAKHQDSRNKRFFNSEIRWRKTLSHYVLTLRQLLTCHVQNLNQTIFISMSIN